jgi:hypothetical protein
MSSLSDVLAGAVSLRTYLQDQLMHGVDSEPLSAGFRAQPRSPNIEDRRNEGPDYSVPMRKNIAFADSDLGVYWPTELPGVDPWGKHFQAGDQLAMHPTLPQRTGWGPGDPYWSLK